MTEDAIRELLQKCERAAERAAGPHYAAAGEKLLEARSQLTHKEFCDWVKRHFKISLHQAEHCIDLAYAKRRRGA